MLTGGEGGDGDANGYGPHKRAKIPLNHISTSSNWRMFRDGSLSALARSGGPEPPATRLVPPPVDESFRHKPKLTKTIGYNHKKLGD